MEILYPAFTGVMFLASVLCGVHAWNHRNAALYGSTIVYGLLLEKLVILYFDSYAYPASKMLDAFGIPLAIGFGWSAVIYSAYVTGRTFGLSRRHLPVFAGLYAVHLDLAMDAIAIRVPFWTWNGPGDWFGVPLGNFLGWYLVALFFTFVYQRVSERTTNPLLVGAGSILGAVLLLIPTLEIWTEITGDSVLREASVLSALLAVSLLSLRRAEIRPRPVSALITTSVFLFHGFFLAVLVVLGLYATQPVLLLLSLSMLAVGAAVHLWPSTDTAASHRSVESKPN
jgi:uncharacterized membrane protein